MERDFEVLRRQLREAQERAEEADRERERAAQHAESERRRAESERRRAESERQRADSERQRAERAENHSRPTTLNEYIREGHRLVHLQVTTEPDKSLTSKGSITNPQRKYVPSKLSAWEGFLDTQKRILGKLHSTFPEDRRAFESVGFLQGLGERVAARRIANEKDLEHIQQNIVEEPVSKIINVLRSDEATSSSFKLGGGVVFDNHPNGLSDGAEEPLKRRARSDGSQLHADQVCVYRHDQINPTGRQLLYVIEHKPPHKLTMPHLRLGLRDMDILADVVNRITIPTVDDPDALFQYRADRIVAAAVSQTYHYMITGGLEYSYLSTGEGYVFFKIDWTQPHHLLFHLAEPQAEVEAHPGNSIHCTAVSQVLAFTLLALESRPRGQDERHSAMRVIDQWAEDYDDILRGIPATERKQTPPPSAFEPRTYRDIDRSPYLLRLRERTPSCRPTSREPDGNESPSESDDESQRRREQNSPSVRGYRRTRPQAQEPISSHPQGVVDSQKRQYCTHQCLLGLVNRGPLDQACPNVLLHKREGSHDMSHPLDHATWLDLLQRQLAQSLDAHVIPLGKQGARGAAMQVTLAEYGYTVIAKCTVPEFVEDLEKEATLYQKLKPLQGKIVPVFLGALRLTDPYEYAHRVRLIHMMLLSWGGDPISATDDSRLWRAAYEQSVAPLLAAVSRLGVIHGDAGPLNVLHCTETNSLMLIDFERARILRHHDLPDHAIRRKRSPIRNRGFRKSTPKDDKRHLRQVVLNGRIHRPADKQKKLKRGGYD